MTTNIYDFTKKIIRFYLIWWIALVWNVIITFFITDVFKYSYDISLFFVFIFNITIVFYLQKYFTFKNTKKQQTTKQIISFIILVVAIMISLKLLVPFFNLYINNYSLSTFVVAWIVTIINFLIQNYLIFNQKYDI